ncbi:MAG: hypothetical protein LBP56_09900 [Odoribacteraceae bacterium]|nr:hypothetical protein [Odoribacteraceae bacterium]
MKNTTCALLLVALAGGCTTDNGNYEYTRLNTIEIDGFAADTTYRVDQFDTLVIDPAPRFAAGPLTDLSHEWKINHEVISTAPVLRAPVTLAPNTGTAYYEAGLRVTDNATGLKYYKNFKVIVTTSITTGLFILSERADETARLSFQRRDKPGGTLVHDLFEEANPAFGPLGKKPRQVYYSGLLGAELGVLCGEGERQLSILNPATLALQRSLSGETIRGGYDGDFTPERLTLYMGGMIVGGGKLYNYNYMGNKAIYRPVPVDEDAYDFAGWAETNMTIDAYAWMTYDNKSEQFLQLEPGTDPLLYDKITPLTVEGDLSTAGQRFLAGGTGGTSAYTEVRAILYNSAERKAYLYGITIVDDFDPVTWEIIINMTVTRLGEHANLVDERSVCFYNAEYWYLATGNTVKRLHEKGSAPLDWFTAPRGEVTAMTVDKSGPAAKRLLVATRDGAKSYIHVIDIATGKSLEPPLEMDGKIVSLLAKGTWKY